MLAYTYTEGGMCTVLNKLPSLFRTCHTKLSGYQKSPAKPLMHYPSSSIHHFHRSDERYSYIVDGTFVQPFAAVSTMIRDGTSGTRL